MMKRMIVMAVLTAVLLGCKEEGSAGIPEKWAGKWQGPEGTFLLLEKTPSPRVTIEDLDGPRRFDVEVKDGVVHFMRDGKDETIHAGNGAQTGMKWLANKEDCLIVHEGEGYCRD